MRYRQLSPTGDFTIGLPWFINSPQAVAQAISTRLKLWLAEWFMDTSDGTPWLTQVLGERYNKTPDAVGKRRILGTTGVTSIVNYASNYDGNTRTLTISTTVQSLYSVTPVSVTVSFGV